MSYSREKKKEEVVLTILWLNLFLVNSTDGTTQLRIGDM
jgi:hypothetical protein